MDTNILCIFTQKMRLSVCQINVDITALVIALGRFILSSNICVTTMSYGVAIKKLAHFCAK